MQAIGFIFKFFIINDSDFNLEDFLVISTLNMEFARKYYKVNIFLLDLILY